MFNRVDELYRHIIQICISCAVSLRVAAVILMYIVYIESSFKVNVYVTSSRNDIKRGFGELYYVYNYLSKYTIEPDSCVPLFMVCHFQSII